MYSSYTEDTCRDPRCALGIYCSSNQYYI